MAAASSDDMPSPSHHHGIYPLPLSIALRDNLLPTLIYDQMLPRLLLSMTSSYHSIVDKDGDDDEVHHNAQQHDRHTLKAATKAS